ncbi:MAG: DUF58 domain-containing protein [Silvanigrellales bacterium]|nr:DUF58 domain-containing protein [Silvanigrellales bacterium]
MNLGELASLLPADPALWPEADPSRAFPYDFRATLGTKLAGLFSAADRARPRAAWRLGVSTRAYEPGDAFKDLSLQHLARLGEYHTRIDNAPGRSTAVIVLHLYSNMVYKSAGTVANKGQQALALAGLLSVLHLGALHGVRILKCFEADLPAFLAARASELQRARWLWVATDALFRSDRSDGGAALLSEFLSARPNLTSSLLVVRDARELPRQSVWGQADSNVTAGGQEPPPSAQLNPYPPSGAFTPERFSGETYESALASQLEGIRDTALRQGFGWLATSPSRSVEQVAKSLCLLC